MKNRYRPFIQLICLCAITALTLSACLVTAPPNTPPAPNTQPNTSGNNKNTEGNQPENAAPVEQDNASGEDTGDASAPPEETTGREQVFTTTNDPLPADPIPVTFETEDGRTLEGIYFPGAYNPGPVIVLMHWAGGDMHDWDAIAPWLQNRGGLPLGTGDGSPWWDPTWFPELPEWASYSVLVFNFGGWGNSQGGRDTLALDAKAAIDFASMQADVNPELITTMGASIGADGSPDGCYLQQMDGSSIGICLGGFSLSPGNFQQDSTNFPYTYTETIEGLMTSDQARKVVYCLAAEGDYSSPDTCLSASGYDNYHTFIYPGDAHGMRLVVPDLFPQDPAVNLNALQIYLEFLQDVYQVDFSQ